MSYVKTINEDGAVSDIMAKALDPVTLVNGFTQETAGEKALDAAAGKTLHDSLSTLDDAVVKKANLVNGFTQTTAGQNALDAAAGKTLNDALTPTSVTITRDSNTSVGTNTSIQCYQVGKIVVFWGSIYLKNVSANANVICASGFPSPISNFTTTSSGGYSVSNNMAVWVQKNDGAIRIRAHAAISSTEVEVYVSGAYIVS